MNNASCLCRHTQLARHNDDLVGHSSGQTFGLSARHTCSKTCEGISTVIRGILQYLVGLSFLTERVSAQRRKQLVPVHAWSGRATFLLGIGTAMVGIQVRAPGLRCSLVALPVSPIASGVAET